MTEENPFSKKLAEWHHEWDDDGCCIHCGFDGAEFFWWKRDTYEGRARQDVKMPPCSNDGRLTEPAKPIL